MPLIDCTRTQTTADACKISVQSNPRWTRKSQRGDNTAADTKMGVALSHDNAELGKVGEIFDKLTQYAEDSIGCQYGTLSADLVEKLAKEGLAIIDRLMGVKG